MGAQGFGEAFHLADATVQCAGDPAFQEAAHGVPGEPQVVDLFIGQFDDVEVIEDDGRLGQMFEDGAPVGGAHVAGHRLDACPSQPQPPPELAQCIS